MHKQDPSRPVTRRGRGRSRATAVAVVLTTGALCAGLAITALPAYADVTSNDYTIGSPSGAVSTVVATPSSFGTMAMMSSSWSGW